MTEVGQTRIRNLYRVAVAFSGTTEMEVDAVSEFTAGQIAKTRTRESSPPGCETRVVGVTLLERGINSEWAGGKRMDDVREIAKTTARQFTLLTETGVISAALDYGVLPKGIDPEVFEGLLRKELGAGYQVLPHKLERVSASESAP